MFQYLIILLDDTSTAYCHVQNPKAEKKLISQELLKEGILFGMKENLMIQFVYPLYALPIEYDSIIETIDHLKYKGANAANTDDADVVICNSLNELNSQFANKTVVWRTNKQTLFANAKSVAAKIELYKRFNICLTDIETFTETDFIKYKNVLDLFSAAVKKCYVAGNSVQFNLLTDRILLDKMNNCSAGVENITLAPNGKFYTCPAFYYSNETDNIGDLKTGIQIKNRQLLKLDHAPLCRQCDAYQCHRCIWQNMHITWDINTPSHEQCVIAHLERNASRTMLLELQADGIFTDKEIKEITYLDPFDVRNEW